MKIDLKTGELRKLFKASLLATCVMAAQPVFAQAEQGAASEDDDEIVVTATRRDLKVSDIPLSISALSQETLTTRGVRDSSDIVYAAPGLSIIEENNGTENISVRGVVALGLTATTAFYLDETPIAQTFRGNFSPRYFDIERVEVLRGPQGTLFGASSLGGAIRVITKKPNLSGFEGAVRAEGSTTRLGKENYVLDGAVSVPIINDVLALRVTGFYEKQSGWVKAFTPNLSDDPADYFTSDGDGGVAYQGFTGPGKRVGDETFYGGRAALLLQPSDAFKLTATYHWQKRKNDGFNNADRSIGLGLPGSDFRQARSVDELRRLRTQLANLTGEFDAGFARLTSSTSYEWSRGFRQVDLTPLIISNVVGPLGGLPRDASGLAGASINSQTKLTNFTQEVRVVSTGDGPFNWIIGGYYNRTKFTDLQDVPVRGLTAALVGSPFDGLAPNDSYATLTATLPTREFSVFGEIGYKFTDKLSATLGLRNYNIRTQSASGTFGLGAGGTPVSVPIPNVSKESGFTYKAVLNYKPNDDLLLFAGYTTGYRPGGPNPPAIVGDVRPDRFTSDKLSQYELGWKSSWLDRALSVNGALFYIDWTDIPTSVIGASGLDYTINGPKARNYGAELELVIRPTKGFDVTFGLTALNAEYSEDFVFQVDPDLTDPTNELITVLKIDKGTKLPNVPEITLNAGINYEWSISGDANARIGANVAHVTKRSQTVNDVVAPLPGFVNAGLSAGVDFGAFDISIFARNLFDTRALVANSPQGFEISGGVRSSVNTESYLQPRTIGAALQIKF